MSSATQEPASKPADHKKPLRILAFPAGVHEDENPYIRQLYEHLVDRGAEITPLGRRELLNKHEIVHIHWPEAMIRWSDPTPGVAWDIAKFLCGVWIARRRGARLVWTVHNLEWHEMSRPWLYGFLLQGFGRMVDLLITLNDSSHRALLKRYPYVRRASHVTVPHGHYRDAYPTPPSRVEARARLCVPEKLPLLLSMGQIRPYKNVVGLVRAFRMSGVVGSLLVAGSTQNDDALEEEIRNAAGNDDRIVLRLGYVPDAEVGLLHAAADVVVLPYESPSLLNSGAVILGLSFARPVVTRRSASTDELSAMVGAGWVHTFDGGPEEAISQAMRVAKDPPRGTVKLTDLEWDSVADATYEAMKSVTRGS